MAFVAMGKVPRQGSLISFAKSKSFLSIGFLMKMKLFYKVRTTKFERDCRFPVTDKTIAILPFVNMSSSQENEYFSDGITEEIINALAKIGQLKVTSRTSSFFFKGKNLPISEIGQELGVTTILEGSVRLSGKLLRITAQLIEVANDYHFWSETWDRELDNIFEIQDEISLLIADKLREHFGHFEIGERLVSPQTTDKNAYELCLKGKYLENQWNPEDSKRAISFYEQAIELDPKYAQAYVGMANCYSFLGTTAFLPFAEAWGKTVEFTQRAFELNSELSGVYYLRANQAFFLECDHRKSLTEIKKAVAINPNNAEAQQFASFLYVLSGDREQAGKHLDIALAVNPLSEETHFFRAYFHYMSGAYAKALQMLDRCLESNMKNIPAHSVKTLCLLKLERYTEVISYFDHIPPEVVIEGEKMGAIALAHALNGDAEKAKEMTAELELQAQGPNGFTADSYCFMMYSINGERDKAFAWVAKAIERKSSLVLLRYTDPLVHSLQKDTRYSEFLTKLFPKETKEVSKQKQSLLDSETASVYSKKLLEHLEEDKTYLQSDLSLRGLAQQIELHPNHLSWLLNTSIGKNFNEFINQYRVEAFKAKAKDPRHAHLSIEGLAYESGFNSKTVFNTYFKKETGLTPTQFLKQQA